MPVHINYKGRTGNKLFQYIAARVFSEKNNLNLVTDFPDTDIIKPNIHKNYPTDGSERTTIRIDKSSFNNDEIIFSGNNIKYIFDDYFHNGDFFSNNYELIKTFFKIEKNEKNNKDIVLHLRLFDYLHGTDIENPTSWDLSEVIHPDYYINILDNESYEKVYIVVDDIKCEWEKKYLSYFKKYNPIIVTNTPKEDFFFLMSFNKIINSNSTFSYWASFFSDAEKIYTFKNAGFYGRNKIHIEHTKNLCNIKNKSISVDEKFYFGE